MTKYLQASGTPSVVLREAAATTKNLLPGKSKDRFKQEYQNFTKTLKSSSLWPKYSMLMATINLKDNTNIFKVNLKKNGRVPVINQKIKNYY